MYIIKNINSNKNIRENIGILKSNFLLVKKGELLTPLRNTINTLKTKMEHRHRLQSFQSWMI
jgi:hypothetical protein